MIMQDKKMSREGIGKGRESGVNAGQSFFCQCCFVSLARG